MDAVPPLHTGLSSAATSSSRQTTSHALSRSKPGDSQNANATPPLTSFRGTHTLKARQRSCTKCGWPNELSRCREPLLSGSGTGRPSWMAEFERRNSSVNIAFSCSVIGRTFSVCLPSAFGPARLSPTVHSFVFSVTVSAGLIWDAYSFSRLTSRNSYSVSILASLSLPHRPTE